MLEFMYDLEDMAQLDHFVDTFAENNRFRVTLIGLSGVVLGDSRLSLEELRNVASYSNRTEIIEARESGIGVARRYSDTLKIDQLFVALRYNFPDRKGYFRLALPLIELEAEMMEQRTVLGISCLIALLVALSLSFLTSRYLLSLVKKGEQHLEQRVIKRTKEIEMLQNMGTQLTVCNTLGEAMEVVKLVTSHLLPRYIGALARPHPSKEWFEVVKYWNGPWLSETQYTHDMCWALRTGQSHLGNPDTGNMCCAHSSNNEEQTCCIPLIAQGVCHGVLHFASPRQTVWTQAEQQLASAVAEHASLIFASLELRESLKEQAIRDPLTGLYNRRYLMETMDQEISRAKRRQRPLGLLMIDLDRFKQFNDSYGHDTGDAILSEFGRLIKTIIRDEDVPCRYGGEEFTILLPDTKRERVLLVANKIRNQVRQHQFVVGDQTYCPITLSIGISIFPDNGHSVESLLKTADKSLYKAKKTGRDRVVFEAVA